jgi:hypothetical protein
VSGAILGSLERPLVNIAVTASTEVAAELCCASSVMPGCACAFLDAYNQPKTRHPTLLGPPSGMQSSDYAGFRTVSPRSDLEVQSGHELRVSECMPRNVYGVSTRVI